jgi:hypothetical protein
MEENQDSTKKKETLLPINRGVELMLRREKKESARNGILFKKSFSLLKKKIQIKFEFTWEGQ